MQKTTFVVVGPAPAEVYPLQRRWQFGKHIEMLRRKSVPCEGDLNGIAYKYSVYNTFLYGVSSSNHENKFPPSDNLRGLG